MYFIFISEEDVIIHDPGQGLDQDASLIPDQGLVPAPHASLAVHDAQDLCLEVLVDQDPDRALVPVHAQDQSQDPNHDPAQNQEADRILHRGMIWTITNKYWFHIKQDFVFDVMQHFS